MTSRVELFRDPSKLSSVSRDICAQLYRILRRAPVRDVGPTPQHLTAELRRHVPCVVKVALKVKSIRERPSAASQTVLATWERKTT